jgi:hypothetical protein
MGWQGDYPFEVINKKNRGNGKNDAYREVLGFIKKNPFATVSDIREFCKNKIKTY